MGPFGHYLFDFLLQELLVDVKLVVLPFRALLEGFLFI
jgi:hypothetical protein